MWKGKGLEEILICIIEIFCCSLLCSIILSIICLLGFGVLYIVGII